MLADDTARDTSVAWAAAKHLGMSREAMLAFMEAFEGLGNDTAVGAVGPYSDAVPDRPVGYAFVLWNGAMDPGEKAMDGDLGVGWA